MATGTLAPAPYQTVLDDNGVSISGAKIYTYLAGTTTPAATYTDVGMLVPNSNAIVADSAGRFVAYLPPGTSFKFVYKTAADVTIRTADNISATPAASGNVDVTGFAGQALTAGAVVYLSDGTAGTPGRWFLADADFLYASSDALAIGMVVADIANGSSGTIRTTGTVSGLVGLTAGFAYYVSSTAGALTATPPANRRFVGSADSPSSLVLGPGPRAEDTPIDVSVCDGRLTLTSGTPVTTADVTGATSVYFTPYKGNRIALYDGTSSWSLRTFAELTQALGTLTSGLPYDVFAYDNAGAVATEILAWTNATTRATALVLQDGVYVKTAATTRRYLGSFETTSTTQTEDSRAKRLLWNCAQRARRPVLKTESTTSWPYTLATWRPANNAVGNAVRVLVGIVEAPILLSVQVNAANDANAIVMVAIGVDSTTTPLQTQGLITGLGSSLPSTVWANYDYFPTVGSHLYTWLEFSTAAGTTTWYGQLSAGFPGGIRGWVEG